MIASSELFRPDLGKAVEVATAVLTRASSAPSFAPRIRTGTATHVASSCCSQEFAVQPRYSHPVHVTTTCLQRPVSCAPGHTHDGLAAEPLAQQVRHSIPFPCAYRSSSAAIPNVVQVSTVPTGGYPIRGIRRNSAVTNRLHSVPGKYRPAGNISVASHSVTNLRLSRIHTNPQVSELARFRTDDPEETVLQLKRTKQELLESVEVLTRMEARLAANAQTMPVHDQVPFPVSAAEKEGSNTTKSDHEVDLECAVESWHPSVHNRSTDPRDNILDELVDALLAKPPPTLHATGLGASAMKKCLAAVMETPGSPRRPASAAVIGHRTLLAVAFHSRAALSAFRQAAHRACQLCGLKGDFETIHKLEASLRAGLDLPDAEELPCYELASTPSSVGDGSARNNNVPSCDSGLNTSIIRIGEGGSTSSSCPVQVAGKSTGPKRQSSAHQRGAGRDAEKATLGCLGRGAKERRPVGKPSSAAIAVVAAAAARGSSPMRRSLSPLRPSTPRQPGSPLRSAPMTPRSSRPLVWGEDSYKSARTKRGQAPRHN